MNKALETVDKSIMKTGNVVCAAGKFCGNVVLSVVTGVCTAGISSAVVAAELIKDSYNTLKSDLSK